MKLYRKVLIIYRVCSLEMVQHNGSKSIHVFLAVYEENKCGGIPYVPLLKVPYYIWLGRKKSESSPSENGHE